MVFFITVCIIIEANLNYFYKIHHNLLKKLEFFSKRHISPIKLNKNGIEQIN